MSGWPRSTWPRTPGNGVHPRPTSAPAAGSGRVKLLEEVLVELSSVASKLTTLSARKMIKGHDHRPARPEVPADLARRTMKARRDALVEALDRYAR